MDIDTHIDAIRGIHHGMVAEHQKEKEELELKAHDMRVLGFAEALAFIRHGTCWSHLHIFSQSIMLAEAEATIILLDANRKG